MPDEIADVKDMLLMRLGGEDNRGSPGSKTWTDPTIGLEDFEMFHDYFAFVRSATRFLTTDGRRSAGVDGKFETQNRFLDAGAMKAVPMGLDNVDNGGADFWVDVEADDEVLGKFRQIALTIPEMDIGADVNEGFRRVADGLPALLKFKDRVVDVVGVVHRDVAVNRLGSPKLGRHFDCKGIGARKESRERGRCGAESRNGRSRSRASIEEQSGRNGEQRMGQSM